MTTQRPVHTSLDAYLRSLQMSEIPIFVHVEGWKDRSFYDKLCGIVCGSSGMRFEICLANEVPACCGGKQGLLKLFEHLESRNQLVTEFHGKRTVAAFCIDKDVDDLIRSRTQSEYLIYTEYYSLENYYFVYGNLIEAISVTACLPRSDVEAVVGASAAQWCRRASEHWKTWSMLCLLAEKLGATRECSFKLTSKAHPSAYGPCDDSMVSELCSSIRARTDLGPSEFDAHWDWVRNQIESVYAQGRHNSVFPGRWYVRFIIEDSERIADGRSYDKNSVGRNIMKCLAATLDFTAGWAERYRLFFSGVLAAAVVNPARGPDG